MENLIEKILCSRLEKLIPVTPTGNEILKNIYQVSTEGTTIPEVFAANARELMMRNPDWGYELYDENKIDAFFNAEFPQLKQYYRQINVSYPAAKADLFRYLLLYKNGGIYLDLKSTITKPLNTHLPLTEGPILSTWIEWNSVNYKNFNGWGKQAPLRNMPDGEYQQWHIITPPGHPYLRAVIITVLSRIICYISERHRVGRMRVLQTTGPIPYSEAIEPIRKRYLRRIMCVREKLGLEYAFSENIDHTKMLGKKHYSECTEPVINMKPFNRIINSGYCLIKRVKNTLTKFFKKPQRGYSF